MERTLPVLELIFFDRAALIIENCLITNYNSNAPIGIRFRPLVAGSQLVVTDTTVTNNGSGSSGGGIVIVPQSGSAAQVALNRVTVARNVFGIAIDSTGGASGITATISDSEVTSNGQDGILAVGGSPIAVMVKNTKSINNNIGVRSIGANVTIRIDGSTITGNGTGLNFSNGGALLSFGNNAVQANAVNGAFSGSVGLQ